VNKVSLTRTLLIRRDQFSTPQRRMAGSTGRGLPRTMLDRNRNAGGRTRLAAGHLRCRDEAGQIFRTKIRKILHAYEGFVLAPPDQRIPPCRINIPLPGLMRIRR
jgi:hypothetical protein